MKAKGAEAEEDLVKAEIARCVHVKVLEDRARPRFSRWERAECRQILELLRKGARVFQSAFDGRVDPREVGRVCC